MRLPTVFTGGPLDGQELPTLGATFYLHELPAGKYAEYRRTRTVYSDGSTYANARNAERISHLEYAYTRELDRP